MATLNTLGVGSLALRGAGDQYHNLSRIFASLAEAQTAKTNGDFVPEAGRANLVLVVGHGLMRYDDTEADFVPVDSDIRTRLQERIDEVLGNVGENFDTLKELADAIGNSPTFFVDTTNSLSVLTSGLATELTDRTTGDNTLQSNLDAVELFLKALIGSDVTTTDLGAFTGSTIADASTVKEALQALETSLEAVDIDTDDLAALTGISENITHLGGFTGSIIGNDVSVKAALQSLETAAEAEAARALDAETTLQSDIDQNEADADAADAALGVRIDSVEAEIDTARTNIYTALGQTEGATAMGTFTGSTLGDGQTIKQLLQTLETATETEISDRQAAIADILDGATFTGDIVLGTLARLKESGNELKIQNDAQSSSIVLGPKISLQPATGSRIELFETVRMPDGTDLTVTGAELNFVDGVTSNIQTQLDAIQADVNQNESDADAADAALSGRLDVLEADPTTETALATERARIDAILAGADADKDTFAEIVTLINSVDTENDNAFAAYVLSNDAAVAAVQADVDQNETDSDAADAALSARLDVLEADPTTATALAAVQADVDQNEADADAAIAGILDGATFTGDIVVDEGTGSTIKLETSSALSAGIHIEGPSGSFGYIDTTNSFGNDSLQIYSANTWVRAINNGTGNLIIDGTLTLAGTALTATFAELNFVDGVTSNIQTQLDAKLAASAVSAFGLTLVDDADAAAARTTLGVDAAGTDNSTDVTIAVGRDYISLSGQELTLGAVDLAADVTGTLPVANGGTGATDVAGIKSTLDIDHIHTTIGVAANADDLGTFTGTTIDDNVTIKAALQALETAQETTQADVDQNESDADAAIAAVLAGTSIPGPYNNDTAAGDNGVAIGAIYKNSNGTVHWRIA